MKYKFGENTFEAPSIRESEKLGGNIIIDLTFQRHGIRDGMFLTDDGRLITESYAKADGKKVVNDPTQENEYHAAKAIGSPADTPPQSEFNPDPKGRALETANITANVIAGDRAGDWIPRLEQRLNYENIAITPPYDHTSVYNAGLVRALEKRRKETLSDCSAEEKAQITQEVQVEVVSHIDSLHTPEATAFKREAAGMLADIVEHYSDMATLLKNDSRVAYTAGTHGPTLEYLFQQAAVWEDNNGQERIGYESIEDYGGAFDSSEAYTVRIQTDKDKKLKELTLIFANPHGNRPQGSIYLDLAMVHKLAADYKKVYKAYQQAYDSKIHEFESEGKIITDENKKQAVVAGQAAALICGVNLIEERDKKNKE
jgi:hypothetical protein